MKKLYLSRTDKKFLGVIGGIAEYYNVDSTLLRVFAVIIALITGIFPALLGYIVLGVIIPERPLHN